MTKSEELPIGRNRLSGKVALVIGGGAIGPGWGNGKAAAVLYAREGASVCVVDMRKEAADETVAIIHGFGGEAFAFSADATAEDAVAGLVAACVERYERIDVLHNNVGGQGTGRSLKTITVADWNATLARNLTSAMLSCRAVVPIMEAQGGGSIINISSISSLRHLNVPTAVYAAAKGGLNEFTKNIALQQPPMEFAPTVSFRATSTRRSFSAGSAGGPTTKSRASTRRTNTVRPATTSSRAPHGHSLGRRVCVLVPRIGRSVLYHRDHHRGRRRRHGDLPWSLTRCPMTGESPKAIIVTGAASGVSLA